MVNAATNMWSSILDGPFDFSFSLIWASMNLNEYIL